MHTKLYVVKIGGHVLDQKSTLNQLLEDFARLPSPKILVHGGGKRATALSRELGIETQMYEGRRITSTDQLEVVTMVYAGLLNKNIVSTLVANHCLAIGLSGADADLIRANKRPPNPIDFGWVGDVTKVADERIQRLLESGFSPVFCALTHDGKGHLLNTNADTVASALASAMSRRYETELFYCFEKKGVLRDAENNASLIPQLDRETYQKLKDEGIIHSGMLPKLTNCFEALDKGVKHVLIGDSTILRDKTAGTTLYL